MEILVVLESSITQDVFGISEMAANTLDYEHIFLTVGPHVFVWPADLRALVGGSPGSLTVGVCFSTHGFHGLCMV